MTEPQLWANVITLIAGIWVAWQNDAVHLDLNDFLAALVVMFLPVLAFNQGVAYSLAAAGLGR